MGSTKLIDKVIQIQEELGYSDGEIADILGCSRQLYQMTRTGKVRLGSKILKGAVRAFPELEGDAIYFLTDGATGLADSATLITIPSQNAQDGKFRRFRGWLRGFINRTRKLWQNSREP